MLWRRRTQLRDIDPDEIFVDAANQGQFDTDRFEGKMEKSLDRRRFFLMFAFLGLLFAGYAMQAFNLQFVRGVAYAERAENNQLGNTVLFAPRGLILDRTGRLLAGNANAPGADFPIRSYAAYRGIASVVGYARPPAKDTSGNYFRVQSEGAAGIEAVYDKALQGHNGMELTETDALHRVVSQSAVEPAVSGTDLTLSIDAEVSQALYDTIADVAQYSRFVGGAGVMMDVHTGEIIAMVSYPEYSLQTMANGTNTPAIQAMLDDPQLPFLNRTTQGVFAPGSIVKPYVGVAALMEAVIDENKQILSTGSITVPNPYDPSNPGIFKDWKAHGWVDLRRAIAVSSDVYFYEVGGGYPGQKGLGITKLDQYFKLFGFGQPTGIEGLSENSGNLSDPAWKAKTFPSDPTWRLGDTYHTAIGQYGMQVTPIQMARAISALANGGTLLTPTLIASVTPEGTALNLSYHALQVVREGMRMGVTDGVAGMLNVPYVKVAAKTGTAEVGMRNEYDNSNIEVFFPYDNPKYAVIIMMEKAPAPLSKGATNVAAEFIQRLHENAPEYLE